MGSLLFVAALGFHYTARHWYPAGLTVMHGGPINPGYALALLGACGAAGILLWHYVGSRVSAASRASRISWCIGLGVAATTAIFCSLMLVLAANVVLDALSQPHNNLFALFGLVLVMVLVGAWSGLVPALPYGMAAGAAFYLIAEQRGWMRK